MDHTKQLLFLAISLLTFVSSQAQDRFERLYRAFDRNNLGADIQQTRDGGYLILSIASSMDSVSFPSANVTRLSPKGDIKWSKDFTFDEDVAITGNLVLLDRDTFAFTAIEKQAGMNKIITKVDPSGNVVWSKGFGKPDSTMMFGQGFGAGELIPMDDGSISMFGAVNGEQPNLLDIYASRTDGEGNLHWAKTFANKVDSLDTNEEIVDAQKTFDNGFILLGKANRMNEPGFFLTNLDSLGNVVWGKRYSSIQDGIANSLYSIIQLPDKGFLVGGAQTVDSSGDEFGLLIRLDSMGRFTWTRTIDFPSLTDDLNFVTDLLLSPDSTAIIAGRSNNPMVDTMVFAFMMEMTVDGDTLWKRQYHIPTRGNPNIGGLISTAEGGFAYYLTGSGQDTAIQMPYIIKVDKNGLSSCSTDSLAVDVALADSLRVDTFILEETSLDTVLMKEPEVMRYDSFSVPVLSLGAASFCEGEPILATFDATVFGGVSYQWSTGATTPMITVTQQGQFSVNVRVETDLCFNLCDTATVNVIPFPTVQIDAFEDNFCTQGFIQLQASGSGIQGLQWSTGDTNVPAILIAETGTFSVTATNSCGSGFDDITIDQLPNTPPEITTGIDVGDFCTDGMATLLVFGTGFNSILWQETGDTTTTSQVNAPGTYNVVATNLCGSTSADIDFQTNPPLVQIQPTVDSFCTDGFATLLAIGLGIDSLQWSTGATTDTIQVSDLTTYSVTAFSNFCGSTTEEVNLADIVPDCNLALDNCIKLPNAFTPNGDGTNDAFGPVSIDNCDLFRVVEFKIYSRWGEKVFSTKTDGEKWDGRQGGDPAPIDVYAWIMRAVGNDGKEQMRQGEVSLLR